MKTTGFIWLEEIVEKIILKHDVYPVEVEEVFANAPRFRFVEKGKRKHEDMYAALGTTNAGRHLAIFFIYKTDRHALVVSARDMNSKERIDYERR